MNDLPRDFETGDADIFIKNVCTFYYLTIKFKHLKISSHSALKSAQMRLETLINIFLIA